MKIIYVTNQIPNYRKKLYEILGDSVDLTIAHYGKTNPSNSYKELKIKHQEGRFFIYTPNSIDFNNYDIVIVWGNLRLYELYKLIFKKNKKFKVMLFGPGVSASYTKKYDNDRRFAFIYNFILKKVDVAVFYDNYPVIKYSAKGISPNKLFCAPNTVVIDSKNPSLEIKKDSFLFFGTLYKEKGIMILLESYKLLKSKSKGNLPNLNIIGDGPELAKLNNWVNENNLDDIVRFHGRIVDSDVIEVFFRKSYACISPNQAGLSVIESMAYGVPFITSKYPITGGEYNAIIEGANGFFYDGSVNGLAQILDDIMNTNNLDLDLYSNNCLEYYNRFRSPELWVNQMLKAIDYVKKSKLSNKVCCSLNFAPHYREEIFLRMEKDLDCDFFFGNSTYGSIKKTDYSKFDKKVVELEFRKVFNQFYILKGQIKLSFSNYSHYIITGQPFNLTAWALLILNKIRGKKTFIWNHGWYGNENFLKKTLKKIQLKLAEGYFLYGTYAKNLMEKERIDSKKIHVVYNSLSHKKQLKIRNQLKKTSIYFDHFNNSNPTLLFIGRLTKIKKLHLLLDAMQLANKEGCDFNLILIGDGTEKQFLEGVVEKFKLKHNTWFYGYCYKEEQIGELIYNADICISPGNIGLTAIHSLMYGTPAITHSNFTNQMPEFEAIEEGNTGSFFKENDSVDLKSAIIHWLEKHPKKEESLIQACYNKIDVNYNPNYQIKILKKVLQ